MRLLVHAFEPRSRANGPGVRAVLWVQGCSLGCPGCYNPGTHAAGGGDGTDVAELVDRIAALAGTIDGISVSGGEPLEQPDGLLALLQGVRAATTLSVLVFSGFTRAEIEARPLGPRILALVDVLIDGRYRSGERVATGLQGSANQRIHLLTDRHTLDEVRATPEAEIRIDPDGNVIVTGVNPVKLPRGH